MPDASRSNGPSSVASSSVRSATAVMWRSGLTISDPRPSGPTQCSTRQYVVRCIRPPGSGRRPCVRSHASQSVMRPGCQRLIARGFGTLVALIVRLVPDRLFSVPQLAQVYDALDPDRRDLEAYLALMDEFRVRSVVDVGCGTGTFAIMLAARGCVVTGIDPAEASL